MWRLRAARVEFGNRLAEAAQKELRRNRAATKIQGIHRKRMSRKRIKLLLAQRAKPRVQRRDVRECQLVPGGRRAVRY